LGQLGRRQRVSDRAQIVQLVLGDLEALMQRGEISVAYRDFLAKASDQRLLDMLSFVQIVHVPLLGGDRRSQPLKLPFVFWASSLMPVRYALWAAYRTPRASSRTGGRLSMRSPLKWASAATPSSLKRRLAG
jgi:hypothetical protein